MKAGDMEYKYLPSALSKEPNCAPGAIKKPPKENRKSVEKRLPFIAAAIASKEGFAKYFYHLRTFLDLAKVGFFYFLKLFCKNYLHHLGMPH